MRGRHSANVASSKDILFSTQEGGAVKRKASDDAGSCPEAMPPAKRRTGEEGQGTTTIEWPGGAENLNMSEMNAKGGGQQSRREARQVRQADSLKEGEDDHEGRERPSSSPHAKGLALARLCAWALALFSYDRVCSPRVYIIYVIHAGYTMLGWWDTYFVVGL